MVHALYEAHRVLKPDGILIDLRPAPAHRRLGIGQGRTWQFVGQLHEILDDDHAADAAVARVVREGLFHPDKRIQFQLDRVMDSTAELRDFLDEFAQRRDLVPHTSLLERLERKYARLSKPSKITVRGPMHLAVLTKLTASSTSP
jgi:SAM-dependent methyltransferase